MWSDLGLAFTDASDGWYEEKEGEGERKNPKSLASTVRKVVELFTFF